MTDRKDPDDLKTLAKIITAYSQINPKKAEEYPFTIVHKFQLSTVYLSYLGLHFPCLNSWGSEDFSIFGKEVASENFKIHSKCSIDGVPS